MLGEGPATTIEQGGMIRSFEDARRKSRRAYVREKVDEYMLWHVVHVVVVQI